MCYFFLNLLSLAESEKLQMLSLMTLSMKNRIVKYDFVIDKLGMVPGDYAKLEELMMNTMCMGYLGTVAFFRNN